MNILNLAYEVFTDAEYSEFVEHYDNKKLTELFTMVEETYAEAKKELLVAATKEELKEEVLTRYRTCSFLKEAIRDIVFNDISDNYE